MTRVFYVEDDALIRQAVLYALEATGFAAEGFADGAEFLARLSTTMPHLVLLDIMLPGDDGLRILRTLRTRPDTKDTPVILITAKGAEWERITGLEGGADDYVPKPFSIMELISRIKAVLRRRPGEHNDQPLTMDKVTIDRVQHRVLADGRSVSLTKKEFDLLYCLMANAGRVFSRDELLDRIWGYDAEGETRTVDVHIGALRHKLGCWGRLIRTVRGVGYKVARGGEHP